MCTLSDPSILKDAQRIKTLENIIDFTPENLNNVRTFSKRKLKVGPKTAQFGKYGKVPLLISILSA